MIHELIDFSKMGGTTEQKVFHSNSLEYIIMNNMKEENWINYLEQMEAKCVSVEYNLQEDTFVVRGH